MLPRPLINKFGHAEPGLTLDRLKWGPQYDGVLFKYQNGRASAQVEGVPYDCLYDANNTNLIER